MRWLDQILEAGGLQPLMQLAAGRLPLAPPPPPPAAAAADSLSEDEEGEGETHAEVAISARVRSLYALAAMVRLNSNCTAAFAAAGGPALLLSIVASGGQGEGAAGIAAAEGGDSRLTLKASRSFCIKAALIFP